MSVPKLQPCTTGFGHAGTGAAAEWTGLDASTFKLRIGPNYSKNKKKDKSIAAMYEIIGIDAWATDKRLKDVGSKIDIAALIRIGRQRLDQLKKAQGSSNSTPAGSADAKGEQSAESCEATDAVDAGEHKDAGKGAGEDAEAVEETKKEEEEEESAQETSGVPDISEFPPIFIQTMQLPNYGPSLFSSSSDGPGWTLAIYSIIKDPVHDVIRGKADGEKMEGINMNAVRLLKRYVESNTPGMKLDKKKNNIWKRLKGIVSLENYSALNFGAASRKVISSYNYTPFIMAKCAEWYRGPGYFEVDTNVHEFIYLAKATFNNLKYSVAEGHFQVGIVIQGNTDDELPETILCCGRMVGMDLKRLKPFPLKLK